MIPRTFPSTYASNGQQQMVVHFLTSVAGLARWSDYIPVKLVQGGPENSYSGTIDVAVIPSLTAQTQAWKEYIPVYLDDAGTDAWTVNAVGYIPYNYALFTDASMQLDLTNGGELDPRITFTRTSNATVTDSTGTLVYAPHNLLTFSESFDNSSVVKVGLDVAANTAMAPDGTMTADVVSRSADGTANRNTRFNFTTAQTGTYIFSQYCKPDSATNRVALRLQDSAAVGGHCVFELVGDGSIVSSSGAVGTIEKQGDWYRVSVTVSLTGTFIAIQCLTFLGAYGNSTDPTPFSFWGAQLNVGSLQPYYPTTRKNLLGFTQEFDNAGWTKTATTIDATKVTAPDGSLTGQRLVPTAVSTTHFIGQPATFISGTVYTLSVYAKADGYRYLRVGFPSATFASLGRSASFDLQTGASGVIQPGVTTTIVNAGNGWFRCSITATANASATNTSNGAAFNSQPVDDALSATFTGDGTSGAQIWGAQLSDSASLDPYVYNPGAAPASTAYFGPRFDYDPVTLAPKGLLIEEQRTNSIRNNTMVGAVAGTPGTAPTNWTVGTIGLGQQIVGTGVENGIAYIDIRLFGTTAAQFGQIFFDVISAATASAAQQWTNSAYLRLVAGSFTNISAQGLANYHYNASSGLISVTAPSTSITGTLTRVSTTSTTPANTAFVRAGFFFNGQNASGDAVDFTLRIGLPQLELGAFATSPILTTTAAATRAADVAVMTGANFSNWYNQAAGSPYFEGATYSTTNTSCGISIDDNTLNNRIQLRRGLTGPTSQLRMVSSGGAIDVANTSGTALGVNKIAAGATASDQAAASNGSLFTGITSITPMPTVTQMQIGNGPGSTIWNGHIRRIAYYPRRLSNAELQGITS
jgi:hypothetical protein